MGYKDISKQKEYQRKWYKEHKNEKIAKVAEYRKIKQNAVNALKKKCVICGESTTVCLDFHHLEEKNDFRKSVCRMIMDCKPLPIILEEIEKCVVVCKNCHAKIHFGNLKI